MGYMQKIYNCFINFFIYFILFTLFVIIILLYKNKNAYILTKLI